MRPITFSPASFASVATKEINAPRRSTCPALQFQAACIMFIVITSFAFVTVVPANAQDAIARIWRDVSGQFSVKATLLRIDETSVLLLKEDGKQLYVSISKLSPRDRAFLKDNGSRPNSKSTPDGTRKAIIKALAGAPLPPAEMGLRAFQESLPIPVFIDVRALEEIGLASDVPVKLTAGHSRLQDQLDEALNPIDLSWCTTQTVLVVSSKEALEDSFADPRFYRIATPRGDFTSVMQRLMQISEDSWDVFGGRGSIVPLAGLGPVYAIRQSPVVHRELCKAFQMQSAPHQYGHPLDLRSISISMEAAPISDILKAISEQIDKPIEESSGLVEFGISLSDTRMDIELENVSAKDALDLVLSQVKCTWMEDEQKIAIEAMKDAEKALSTQRLSIQMGAMNANQVINAVQICVAPDAWEVLGGEGAMSVARPGLYVIRQGQPAMREVEQFVRDLQMLR